MLHDPAVAGFVASLTQPAPPAGASPALRGVWHALRGEWDAAHDAVQPDAPECAWVHAALHREEGDMENAGYWYRLARQAVACGPHRDEYLAIAQVLLARSDDG
ncbi:MAG TPA: hypothetical protein VFZ65_05355 [Planctomycetota bacterium]|nr:hypothetical protein [Planctomycetota bacterium]